MNEIIERLNARIAELDAELANEKATFDANVKDIKAEKRDVEKAIKAVKALDKKAAEVQPIIEAAAKA